MLAARSIFFFLRGATILLQEIFGKDATAYMYRHKQGGLPIFWTNTTQVRTVQPFHQESSRVGSTGEKQSAGVARRKKEKSRLICGGQKPNI